MSLDIGPHFERLSRAKRCQWRAIQKGWRSAIEQRERMAKSFGADQLPMGDAAVVVFGSLARGELTTSSDVDWTLLIDGRADAAYLGVVNQIRTSFYKKLKLVSPGPSEMFGGMTYAHDLVHDIGGVRDHSHNMSRRLLLVLESSELSSSSSSSPVVSDRVIRQILQRYVIQDGSFSSYRTSPRIPRFFLNDVVRFWRSMAVDYAAKYTERGSDKWALRNIKLRMSRKLLFVKGLWMSLSMGMEDRALKTNDQIVEHLWNSARQPALESLSHMINAVAPKSGRKAFDAYNWFLGMLDDPKRRKALETLSPAEAISAKEFLEARKHAERFDAELREVLFEKNKKFSRVVKQYGVF